MRLKSSISAAIASPIVLPLATIATALAIFIVDTFTLLDFAHCGPLRARGRDGRRLLA